MLKRIIEKNYKWITILLCVIIVLMMLEDIFNSQQLTIDTVIYKNVILNLRSEPLTAIMKGITNLASAYALIAITIASFVFIKNKKIGKCITVNLVLSTLLNQILKYVVQRPRPEGYMIINENGYSFPSGHSMISMAFYGLIIYLIWKKIKNVKIKYLLCGLLSILIPLIGFSRIYLGVHYASDVIGGFAISIAYLVLYIGAVKTYLNIEKEDSQQLTIDTVIYKNVILNLRSEPLTAIMKIITNLASAYTLIAITIASFVFIKNKKIGKCITVNLVLSTLLNQILKYTVQRPRPEGYMIINENGYSFPSGHSMISMAFYGLIIYLIWKKMKNVKLKYILCGFLSILIPLIGFSRIYLGVHYASDVIGGFAISIAYLVLYIGAVKTYLNIEKEEKMNKREMVKLRKKRKKLRNSFKYAFEGIGEALKTEQNLKIHFFIMIVVITAGLVFKINAMEWIACIILFGLVISLELINTAIETTVDIAMPEKNEKAKLAKDVAAGAVLMSAIMAIVVGLIIFLPKIF